MGFNLVEILIVVAMMSVISWGMASLFSTQQSQIKTLIKKQDMLNLKSEIIRKLANSSICTWQLKDKNFSIDPVPTAASPSVTSVKFPNDTLYSGLNNSSAPIAVKNAPVSTSSNSNLIVADIGFENIYLVNAAKNEYLGNFTIRFQNTTSGAAFQTVKVQQIVIATPNSSLPGFARITSCENSLTQSNGGDETGDIKSTFQPTADTGWVLANGGTIGSASSGATLRANVDTQALFELLWNTLTDGQAMVTGGRGGSSSADWTANKRIAVPDLRGRTLFGKDDMDGTIASRVTIGGSNLNGTILGNTGGDQRLHAHTHVLTQYVMGFNASCGCFGGGQNLWFGGNLNGTAVNAEGGLSQNMPPATIVNFEIKL